MKTTSRQRLRDEEITARLNAVYSREDGRLDPVLHLAQLMTLARHDSALSPKGAGWSEEDLCDAGRH